jgi:plasmid stability protein
MRTGVRTHRRADADESDFPEVPMSRRMTIVFDDEELYTRLKVEAARNHRTAKDIVAEALCLYFGPDGDARLRAGTSDAVDAVLRDLGLAKEATGSAR